MTLWDYLKEYFNFAKHFKTLLAESEIADSEVDKHKWILCPQCDVNITKEDVDGNNGICPNCGCKIKKSCSNK